MWRPADRPVHRTSSASIPSTWPPATRTGANDGIELVSYGVPRSPMVRIVDPDSRIECPARPRARSGCTATTWPRAIGRASGDPADLRRQVCDSLARNTRRALAANR